MRRVSATALPNGAYQLELFRPDASGEEICAVRQIVPSWAMVSRLACDWFRGGQ
jgi:hypothetical protein